MVEKIAQKFNANSTIILPHLIAAPRTNDPKLCISINICCSRMTNCWLHKGDAMQPFCNSVQLNFQFCYFLTDRCTPLKISLTHKLLVFSISTHRCMQGREEGVASSAASGSVLKTLWIDFVKRHFGGNRKWMNERMQHNDGWWKFARQAKLSFVTGLWQCARC